MTRRRATSDDTSDRGRNVLAHNSPKADDVFDFVSTNSGLASHPFHDMELFNFEQPDLERLQLERLDYDQYGCLMDLEPYNSFTSTVQAGSETHSR